MSNVDEVVCDKLMSMCDAEHDVPQSDPVERASERVQQMKSHDEHLDVVEEDIQAGVDDGDTCLKLDLRALEGPETPRSAAFAVDSARTLADIPEDYLMSGSARTTASNDLSAAASPKRPQSDVALVPPSPHPASVTSQSAGNHYSEDFSAVPSLSQKPTQTDKKLSDDGQESARLSEEEVKTEFDVSEALSEDQSSSVDHKATSLLASGEAVSPSKSAAVSVVTAFPAASNVAGMTLYRMCKICLTLVDARSITAYCAELN